MSAVIPLSIPTSPPTTENIHVVVRVRPRLKNHDITTSPPSVTSSINPSTSCISIQGNRISILNSKNVSGITPPTNYRNGSTTPKTSLPSTISSTINSTSNTTSLNFNFDTLFDESSTQHYIYTTAARPLIQKAVQGYNTTIFAYGQTGSGEWKNQYYQIWFISCYLGIHSFLYHLSNHYIVQYV